MAKLWICDRLFTFILVGEASGDRKDCAGPDGGMVRVFVKAGSTPDGVGCCEWGRKCGLGGVGAACLAAGAVVLGSELFCCCDRWPGVELDCGAAESAMGTSADGATTRGALVLEDGDGRTGV